MAGLIATAVYAPGWALIGSFCPQTRIVKFAIADKRRFGNSVNLLGVRETNIKTRRPDNTKFNKQ
jgi:hypothetical protein